MIGMKPSWCFSLVLVLCILACHKTEVSTTGSPQSRILGKWNYAKRYYSIGGPGEWHKIEPDSQSIEFKSDGSFLPTESFLPGARKYEVIDSAKIRFTPASTQSGYILMGYSLENGGEELYLYPVDPICIEGCNNQFTRGLPVYTAP
jgi:hypothetical protein